MTTINIDFSGFIQVEFNDLKLTRINNESGKLEPIDITTITPEQAIEGIKQGNYFIQFMDNYKEALDGEETLEASIEED